MNFELLLFLLLLKYTNNNPIVLLDRSTDRPTNEPTDNTHTTPKMSGALASIKTKASAGINKAASAVGIQRTQTEDSNNNTLEELSELCPQLTYQQRLIGFGTCFVLGYFITFMSFNYFMELIGGNPVPFVVLYSKSKISHDDDALLLCKPAVPVSN